MAPVHTPARACRCFRIAVPATRRALTRRTPALLLCAGALGAALAGCAARRPAAPHAVSALPAAADLDALVEARRAAIHSLRALAHLRYRDPAGSQASREAIVVARPDRVRVEVLSVFGSPFVLTAAHGVLRVYTRQDATFYQGHASPENLYRYVRLSLPVTDLVDILLGTPPLPRAAHESVFADPETHAISLRRQLGDGTQLVTFSPALTPTMTEERDAAGRVRWRARFGALAIDGAVSLPTDIRLDVPASARSLEITLQDVDVNPLLAHSIFALQAPPGSRVVDLDRRPD